jgi:hypothetical protein
VRLLETWRKSYRPEERDAGKFHTLDFDFIEAMEYGLPPTTGIGPGIERMAMIFTGQENIDDVIFFPLMRPSVSPLNAAIYEAQETSVAPIEDLAVSFEEFEILCNEGRFKPHAHRLLVKPRLRVWQAGTAAGAGKARVSGHAEIEGFLPNGVLRLAGGRAAPDAALTEEDEKKKVLEFLEKTWVTYLRKKFPECEITVSPATVLCMPAFI